MKTRFKHLSKSTISVILAVMMVVSTFTVGIVATNAAFADSDAVGYNYSSPKLHANWTKDGDYTDTWSDYSMVKMHNGEYAFSIALKNNNDFQFVIQDGSTTYKTYWGSIGTNSENVPFGSDGTTEWIQSENSNKTFNQNFSFKTNNPSGAQRVIINFYLKPSTNQIYIGNTRDTQLYMHWKNSNSAKPSELSDDVAMTFNGTEFVGTINQSASDVTLLINADATDSTARYDYLTSGTTVTYNNQSRDFTWASNREDYNESIGDVSVTYYVIKCHPKTAGNMTVSYNPNTNVVTITAPETSTNAVTFKGLGDTWNGTGPAGTQVESTAEYTYVVQSTDVYDGSKGEAFYFRVIYNGTEYFPSSGSDTLLTENTAVTTTATSGNGAFYFPVANVGATIHASLSGSTLSVWYTPAHTYYPTPEYYVVGRFKVKVGSASGTEYYTKAGSAGSWSSTLTDSSEHFKFTQDGDAVSNGDGTTTTNYVLHTYETLAELSPTDYSGEVKPNLFVVYDRNYHFGESSNSGKGANFVNYRADTSAMMLKQYANLTDNNELQLNDPDNQNGTVVLHLRVTGAPGEGGTIDTGAATYTIWYTMENDKPYAVDGAKLTAAPAKVEQGGNVKLTATYTTPNSDTKDLLYTFQRYNGNAWVNIADAQTGNTLTFAENNVGTNQYRVRISSVRQEGGADQYYPRAATAEGECYEAGLYMSNAIATIPDNTTWNTADLKNQSLYKRTTDSSSNPYEFALSTISGSFDTNAPLYTLDINGKNQNCTIEYSTEVVTIDGVEKAVRTYKVIPNTKCSNPTIFLDITNKDVYAVCDYNGATEGKTLSLSKTVTYYFAERVADCDISNASSANQSAGGTGKGMRIRYWNSSVQGGTSNTDCMGQVDVYTPANVNGSNTIYVNADELYTKNQNVKGAQQFYVYKVDLPIGATAFRFLKADSTVLDTEYLWSQDVDGTTASDVLNPNRIYLFFNEYAESTGGVHKDWYRTQGVILDDHLWNTNSATNQVTTKNFDANLINYTDLTLTASGAQSDLTTQNVNTALSNAYNTAGTPHTLYFGDFNGTNVGTALTRYNDYKNLAQRANSKSYYSSVQDLVGMTLSKSKLNRNGYGYLLDTQGNNTNGISQAAVNPLFDYENLRSNGIASDVYERLHFPMNQSVHNGITTYSYDSTTDYNRIFSGSDFKVQQDSDTVVCEAGNDGYKNYAYGRDADHNTRMNYDNAYIGFFPFGGNTDHYSNTGFGTEFDISFYMTNTGSLHGTDGASQDIMFSFSGDDDVWVYVDGVKVLDLGGDHKVSAGAINFTDGMVYYKSAVNTVGNVNATNNTWAYSSDYVKTVNLIELLGAYGVDFDSTDATTKHTLQMFYMERGTYQSNCSISFNLPQASGLNIKNNIRVNDVNPALKNAALHSATPDYFTYQLSAKTATEAPSGIDGVPADVSGGRDLSNAIPLYPYGYNTYYTYDDVSYQLSKESSGSTSGGVLPNYNDSSYTNAGNVVYALSGNVTATTEGKAFPTGITNNEGIFYLLNNQMANFDSKVPANSYVIVAQKQALGEAGQDNNGLLAYKTVQNNNVGNYYLTSYSVYDEKKKAYIVPETELDLKYGDNDTYYAKQSFSGDDANAFYFANYSGNADDPNSAMRVDFYNDIAVGDIRIEKKLDDNSTSNSIFRFDIEFAGVFGDDTDATWTKYDGLEYRVYNENGDLVYPSAQYYTTRTGIQLRAGEYALIKGVPVETRYKVTERSTVGFSFDNYDLKTYKNANNTEVSVTNGGNTYKYSDSSNSSMTTDSDTVLYTEGTRDDAFKYYKTMIPPVSQTHDTSGNRETYGATAKLVYTNTKENISIVFKYYDRDTTNNKPAAIKDSPTEYSYKFDNLEAYTYYKGINDSAKAEAFAEKWSTGDKAYNNLAVGDFVCIDFEAILKENAVAFAEDSKVQNIIDEYHMWTTQAAAKTAMQNYANLQADNTGATKYTSAQAEYHTQSNGTPNTSGEKWVTYYNSSGSSVDAESFAANAQTDFDSVKSIVVWLYNEPKSYAVNVWGATDESYIHAINTANANVSGAYIANTTGTFSKNSTTAYYSQRIGRTIGDPDYLDALAYMKAYNFSGVVPNFVPGNMTAETITLSNGTTLQFAYWSYNDDGSTVASTEYNYGYRITNNVNLYAVYASEKMSNDVHGLTITQDKDDVYVDVAADGTGVSRTRLNVMFTPYNCPDYDTNIKYAGLVNIYVTNLVKQLRAQDKTVEQIEETIKGLQAKYANQLKSYLATYSAFSQTLNYNNNITPTITLTAKGYVYNALGTGSPSVQLTNKNRVEFTTDFKTSALYPDESHAYHNCVGILQIGAMCYDDNGTLETTHWILSDNCIVRLFTDED